MEWKQNILTAVAMAVVFVLVFKVSLWFMGVPLLIGTIGCVYEARERMRNDRWLRRAARGLCTRCGYDLRGTIIRCPECGHSMED